MWKEDLLFMINALHHFAKGSLSECAHNLIYGFKERWLETLTKRHNTIKPFQKLLLHFATLKFNNA